MIDTFSGDRYTVGIDFGTLSCRALLVRVSDGKELADESMAYPHGVMDRTLASTGAPLPQDFALQDPADYILCLETVIPALLRKTGVSPADVIGVGVDFTTCTVFPIDREKVPLCFSPAFRENPHAYSKLWKHHASQSAADRINALAEERNEPWLGRFGGRISSEWLFPKLLETLTSAPEVYRAADYFVEAGDYMVYLLSGILPVGHTFAAYKGQYVRDNGGWPEKDFFRALDPRMEGVVEEKLMHGRTIFYPGEKVGEVTEAAAKRFGLAPGTAVSAALPDAHVAPPGMRQKEVGDMFAILGTSSCFMLIGDRDLPVPGICGVVRDGLLRDFYGYEAGLCCMGDHFAWVCENAVSPEYVREAEARGIPMIAWLSEKAARQKPGEHGLCALNWWNGNRNPLVDADLSGLLLGMTLRTKPEDVLRALMEATAFGTRMIIDNYRAHGIKVKTFRAGGGIARKNPFLMQLYADILKLEIPVADSAQIPALSSAIYAAVAAGKAAGGYDTVREATDRMGSPFSTVYRPDAAASAVYDGMYEEYKTLFDYFGRGGNDVMKRLRSHKR